VKKGKQEKVQKKSIRQEAMKWSSLHSYFGVEETHEGEGGGTINTHLDIDGARAASALPVVLLFQAIPAH